MSVLRITVTSGIREKSWGEACAAKLPKMNVSKNLNEENLSHRLTKLKKLIDIMKVPTLHRNLGAEEGLGKILRSAPVAPYPWLQ